MPAKANKWQQIPHTALQPLTPRALVQETSPITEEVRLKGQYTHRSEDTDRVGLALSDTGGCLGGLEV